VGGIVPDPRKCTSSRWGIPVRCNIKATRKGDGRDPIGDPKGKKGDLSQEGSSGRGERGQTGTSFTYRDVAQSGSTILIRMQTNITRMQKEKEEGYGQKKLKEVGKSVCAHKASSACRRKTRRKCNWAYGTRHEGGKRMLVAHQILFEGGVRKKRNRLNW